MLGFFEETNRGPSLKQRESTIATQTRLSRYVATTNIFLTDNRMTAIMISFSHANISDYTPRFRGVSLDIDKQNNNQID